MLRLKEFLFAYKKRVVKKVLIVVLRLSCGRCVEKTALTGTMVRNILCRFTGT